MRRPTAIILSLITAGSAFLSSPRDSWAQIERPGATEEQQELATALGMWAGTFAGRWSILRFLEAYSPEARVLIATTLTEAESQISDPALKRLLAGKELNAANVANVKLVELTRRMYMERLFHLTQRAVVEYSESYRALPPAPAPVWPPPAPAYTSSPTPVNPWMAMVDSHAIAVQKEIDKAIADDEKVRAETQASLSAMACPELARMAQKHSELGDDAARFCARATTAAGNGSCISAMTNYNRSAQLWFEHSSRCR